MPFLFQAWDDVVRKEKPKEDAFEYKKRLTLDHEKSKLSLAEIYEQEYIKLNQVRRPVWQSHCHSGRRCRERVLWVLPTAREVRETEVLSWGHIV